MLDPQLIRKDFPQLLHPEQEGKTALHYLDSAASSLTPQAVLDAEIDYYTNSRANVHRGIFKEAVRATELYEETRTKVANFINADAREIIFTSGATESSNMLIRMIDESVHHTEEQKDIVSSVMEHHASLIPLQQYAYRRTIPLHLIPMKGVGLDYAKAEAMITAKTALVSVMLASNVTGVINDIRRIADLAHAQGALMVVDATTAMGHIPVDVAQLGCDALYFSGHKMFAPTGIGILWVKQDVLKKLSPSVFGGHMIARVEEQTAEWAEIPSRFEAGTKNIAGAIGLGVAVDYINSIGLEHIHAYITELVGYAVKELEQIEELTIYAERRAQHNIGIVSFDCSFAHPHDIAEILARDGVAVRAGHHCAIPLHTAFGIKSSTRVSLHIYNTKEDIDALVVAIHKAKKIFTN